MATPILVQWLAIFLTPYFLWQLSWLSKIIYIFALIWAVPAIGLILSAIFRNFPTIIGGLIALSISLSFQLINAVRTNSLRDWIDGTQSIVLSIITFIDKALWYIFGPAGGGTYLTIEENDFWNIHLVSTADTPIACEAAKRIYARVQIEPSRARKVLVWKDLMASNAIEGLLTFLTRSTNEILRSKPSKHHLGTDMLKKHNDIEDEFDPCMIISILDEIRQLFQGVEDGDDEDDDEDDSDSPYHHHSLRNDKISSSLSSSTFQEDADFFVRFFGKCEASLILQIIRHPINKGKMKPDVYKKIQRIKMRTLLFALRTNGTSGKNPFLFNGLLNGDHIKNLLSQLDRSLFDEELIKAIHIALIRAISFNTRAVSIETFTRYIDAISRSLLRHSSWIGGGILYLWFQLLISSTNPHTCASFFSHFHQDKSFELILATRPDGSFYRGGLTLLKHIAMHFPEVFQKEFLPKLFSNPKVINHLNSFKKTFATPAQLMDCPAWVVDLSGIMLSISLPSHPHLFGIVINTTRSVTARFFENEALPHLDGQVNNDSVSLLALAISHYGLKSFPFLLDHLPFHLLFPQIYVILEELVRVHLVLPPDQQSSVLATEKLRLVIPTTRLFSQLVNISFPKGASRPLPQVPPQIRTILATHIIRFEKLLQAVEWDDVLFGPESREQMKAALSHFKSIPQHREAPPLLDELKSLLKVAFSGIEANLSSPALVILPPNKATTGATTSTTTKTKSPSTATQSTTGAASTKEQTTTTTLTTKKQTTTTSTETSPQSPGLQSTSLSSANDLKRTETAPSNNDDLTNNPILVDIQPKVDEEVKIEPEESPPIEPPQPKPDELSSSFSPPSSSFSTPTPGLDHSKTIPQSGGTGLTASAPIMAAPSSLPSSSSPLLPPSPLTTTTKSPSQFSLQQQKFFQRQRKMAQQKQPIKIKTKFDEMD